MKELNVMLTELGISKVRLAKYLGVSRQMLYNYLGIEDINNWHKEKAAIQRAKACHTTELMIYRES